MLQPGKHQKAIIPFLITAFLEGVIVLVVEIAGARALAPFFGASVKVWTAQITATLLCLAIGYGTGGWITRRKWSWDVPFVFCCAGIWLMLYPFLRAEVLELTVKLFGVSQGSFLSSLILFGIPLTCLGMVSPLLIERIDKVRAGAGSAAGVLFFTNTIGGLVGGWITALVLIPHSSLRVALSCTGLVLIAISCSWIVVQQKKARISVVCLLLFAGSTLFFLPHPKGSVIEGNGTVTKVIFSRQSNAGLVQVFDNEDSGARALVIDGIVQGGLVLPASTSLYPFTAYFTFMSRMYHPMAKNALVLGLGAGVVPSYLVELGIHVTAVEIEPVVAEIAAQYFAIPREVKVIVEDARTYLRRTDEKYDLIFMDIFAGEKTPWYMTTREAISEIRTCLNDAGVLLINTASRSGEKDPALAALESSLLTSFPEVVIYGTPEKKIGSVVNVLVVAGGGLDLVEDAYALWQGSKVLSGNKLDFLKLLNNGRKAEDKSVPRSDDWSDQDYLDESIRGQWRKEMIARWGAEILGD